MHDGPDALGSAYSAEDEALTLVKRAREVAGPRLIGEVSVGQAAAVWLEAGLGGARQVAALGRPERLQEHFPAIQDVGGGFAMARGPASPALAYVVIDLLPHLRPRPLGTQASVGFGDRLGIATPGHAGALRRVGAQEGIGAVFAQQSIREMTRTGREPVEVMADATFGAVQAGWRHLVGADADHVKTEADVARCAAAGFSFFTFDLGDHVGQGVSDLGEAALRERLDSLSWHDLQDDWQSLKRRMTNVDIQVGGRVLSFDDETLARAAVKYGAAVAHAARLNAALQATGVDHEVEVSVDETEEPTTWEEHAFVSLELRRLGVRIVSLAPRFVGRFEKGVDFRGDFNELTRALTGHAELARQLGPYKLSLHSGSDKFRVYPLLAQATRGLFHVKTAGTSYLEGLRVVAAASPVLFRAIWDLAAQRYAVDRRTYAVSAEVGRAPDVGRLHDDALPDLLNDDDARQVLHVTFGSVMDALGPDLRRVHQEHGTKYAEGLVEHFVRHLQPLWYIVTRTMGVTPQRPWSP